MSMIVMPSRFSGSTLWTPARLTTAPALWLNESSPITDDGTGHCSQWGISSAPNINFSQATSSRRPAIVSSGQNGKQVLTFDGSDDCLVGNPNVATLMENLSAAAIFVAGSPAKNTTSTFRRLLDFSIHTSGSIRAGMGTESSTMTAFQRKPDTSTTATAALTQPDSAWRLYSSEHDWSGQTVGVRLDGGSLTSTATGQGSGTSDNTQSQEVGLFGSNGTSGQNIAGNCGEIILLQYIPTSTDRQKIEGYLEWRWGTQANLPVGHPYASAPPYV